MRQTTTSLLYFSYILFLHERRLCRQNFEQSESDNSVEEAGPIVDRNLTDERVKEIEQELARKRSTRDNEESPSLERDAIDTDKIYEEIQITESSEALKEKATKFNVMMKNIAENLPVESIVRYSLSKLSFGVGQGRMYVEMDYNYTNKEMLRGSFDYSYHEIQCKNKDWNFTESGDVRIYIPATKIEDIGRNIASLGQMYQKGDITDTRDKELQTDQKHSVKHVDSFKIFDSEAGSSNPTKIVAEKSEDVEERGNKISKNEEVKEAAGKEFLRENDLNKKLQGYLEDTYEGFSETVLGRIMTSGEFVTTIDGNVAFLTSPEHGAEVRSMMENYFCRNDLFPQIHKDAEGRYGIFCSKKGQKNIMFWISACTSRGPEIDFKSAKWENLSKSHPKYVKEFKNDYDRFSEMSVDERKQWIEKRAKSSQDSVQEITSDET